MRVIGITSGKGGVGKTTVAVNLAVELASRGNRVLLLDGDLGLSNAQILLNARIEYSYGHVLTGQKTLEEVLVESEYGVTLVPGSSGSSGFSGCAYLIAGASPSGISFGSGRSDRCPMIVCGLILRACSRPSIV